MMLAQIVIGTNNVPDSTATDIAKVFSDFHLNVSVGTITVGLLVIAKLCVYYRNFALKNKTAEQVGPLSRGIAHLAGSSLPKAVDAPVTAANPEPVVSQAAPPAVVVQPPTVIVPK